MKTKVCTICGEAKLIERFDKHPKTKDGRGSQCRQCGATQRRRRLRQRKARFIELAGGKCGRCGYQGPPTAFDFHHVNGEKEAAVSIMLQRSFSAAKKEAQKCTLVCANCHREIHDNDPGPLLGKRRKTTECGTLVP